MKLYQLVTYLVFVVALINAGMIMFDAYKKALSKVVYFKMLVPISTFFVGFYIIFSSPNAGNCLTSAIFAPMFVFTMLTLRIIICSITLVR